MKSDRLPVLPGPPQTNEINSLECQPGVTAHTDSKGQSGEVSTRQVLRHQLRQIAKLDAGLTKLNARHEKRLERKARRAGLR